MASYGSAIVLCGIIAAFAVHQVFRWLQKRADLHGIETRRYRALLARQTPGHCNNRGFRLDLGNVHRRSRDHPRGVRAARFGAIFRCGGGRFVRQPLRQVDGIADLPRRPDHPGARGLGTLCHLVHRHPHGHHPELKGVEQRHRQLRPAGRQVGDQDPDLGRIRQRHHARLRAVCRRGDRDPVPADWMPTCGSDQVGR
jgi:hypothetical protein